MGQLLVVNNLKFSFEGVFDFEGLFKVLNSWGYTKGYIIVPQFDTEFKTKEGKQHEIKTLMIKNIVEMISMRLITKITTINVKPVEVELDGIKKVLSEGKIEVELDGIIIMDRHEWWAKNPFHWFIHIMARKYFMKDHLERVEKWLISDIEEYHHHLKSYLNVSAKKYNAVKPWVAY